MIRNPLDAVITGKIEAVFTKSIQHLRWYELIDSERRPLR